MDLINSIFKKIAIKMANRSNKSKIAYLKEKGCKLGGGCHLNCGIKSFGTEPYLISLGDDCLIAEEVRFITHDGAIFVLNNLGFFNGERKDKIAPITIGNNVYIGTGAYIMPGVQIGNNCIIGAKALVTKNIPDNSVAVGIPAKVIEDVETFYKNTIEKDILYNTTKMTFEEKKHFFQNMDSF